MFSKSPLLKVVFSVLIVIFFVTENKASAAYSFFNRPLKMISCELLLNGGVNQFRNSQSILPALRHLQYSVRHKTPRKSSDGVSFQDLYYSGSIDNLRGKQSEAILQRINGIEESLIKTDLDLQLRSFEIRGEDVKKALEVLASEEEHFEWEYNKLIQRRIPYLSQFLAINFNFFILNLTTHSFGEITQFLAGSPEAGASSFMISVFFLSSWSRHVRAFLKYENLRYDSYFSHLKKALNNVVTGKDKKAIYAQGSHFIMPSEFHKILMENQDKLTIADRNYAREVAVWEYAPSYTYRLFMSNSEAAQWYGQRIVKNAGDLYRQTYLDHFIYFDEEANEPVWIFFYRAYRQTPAGRKPTPKREVEVEREQSWVGGLKPVTVGGPR